MINEWNLEHLNDKLDNTQNTALYLYTPMCGTCKLAGRMLEVTAAALNSYDIGKADLNFVESLAELYQIESVPCLLIWKNGELTDKIYKFESVPNLFDKLQSNL
ncbi:thioredoxin family protein [Jeotgalibacillus proteolyticus]|uniref:Thiol reductase thioredoxin n=1 Tax=Jeotgalibacillus proteolyticus TaxID=2082395 RepID=A0A2S5GAU6_9BACL|nr:thioredoxin family protein [Jeotgalibacillus proteolyticus]PPA70110.1 thiol reductase thioredoxin [Jeotgalibacillus proteolyticus]